MQCTYLPLSCLLLLIDFKLNFLCFLKTIIVEYSFSVNVNDLMARKRRVTSKYISVSTQELEI